MSDVKEGRPRRQYRSQVREEGARRTRLAIAKAATELFVERGYAGTSLTEVARAAGVARPTVFAAFGSKSNLLKHVLDQALAGDDAPVAVADRPWFRPVWEATTPADVLRAYADVCLVIGGRAAALFETVRRAADDSPEVAELWATLRANRRTGAAMVITAITAVGDLAPGLGEERAVDILWVFNDPGLYATLVNDRGWSTDGFRDWLAEMMRHALLAD